MHSTGCQCLCLLSSLFPLMSLLPPPFCSPRLSTDVAKWTQLANQPASTVGLLCEWVDCLDFSRFRFTCLFYQCSVRGWLVGNNRLPIHITHPNIVLICHHECSGPQFCQVSHPKYVCRLKHRQFVSWSVEKRVCFSSPVQWISPLYMCFLTYCSSILSVCWDFTFFHTVSVLLTQVDQKS